MIWLSISLFSSKQNWHRLLADSIRPFVESNRLIKSYRIEFNYFCGENIRLALLTEQGKAAELSEVALIHFTKYFEYNNLPVDERTLPVDGIFMPFPANTVHFGLYPPEIITNEELERYSLSNFFSRLILSALTEEIDDEMILTFAFYFQLAMVKAIAPVLNQHEDLFFIINESDDEYSTKEYSTIIPDASTMNEITVQVMRNDVFVAELDWLNLWLEYCYKSLNTLEFPVINRHKVIKSHYEALVNNIYNQLGINVYGRATLLNWVRSSLREYTFN